MNEQGTHPGFICVLCDRTVNSKDGLLPNGWKAHHAYGPDYGPIEPTVLGFTYDHRLRVHLRIFCPDCYKIKQDMNSSR